MSRLTEVEAHTCFKVSGQIYHWIGSFCPPDHSDPRFLQLYIFDIDNEVQNRLRPFQNGDREFRPDIVDNLIHVLDEYNELVWLFRNARDKLADAEVPEFKIKLFGVVGSRQ